MMQARFLRVVILSRSLIRFSGCCYIFSHFTWE